MPVANILLRKVGNELREWLLLGIQTGMRDAVRDYRTFMAAGDTARAILVLKRAVDLPRRCRIRVETFIAKYGVAPLQNALAQAGAETLAEINAEVTRLENYALTLYNAKQGGATWDSIAADIESHVERQSEQWVFPLPAGYTDIWGE